MRARRGSAWVPARRCSRRSAKLGLIVIDEEHDASYKHEGDPRYDARDVAAERARRCGATLLLGSATPRPESVHRLTASALRERVDGRPLPPVEVLDMRGATQGLHPVTAEALAGVRARREKAIVLLNRRGWSNFLSCRSCGRVWGCPDCDVALVLHRSGGYLACHHCGHREPAPTRCSDCASTAVVRHGAGTERLQHELAACSRTELFPSCDSMPTPPSARTRLEAAIAGGARAPRTAASGRSCGVSRRRNAACSSAPRWSRRATTSPTSASPWCWTRTPPSGFRTSARRSGRSRSSPSSPDAPGEGAAGGCSCRRSPPRPGRSGARRPTTAAASSPASSSAGALSATRPSPI